MEAPDRRHVDPGILLPFSHFLRKDGLDPTSVQGAADIFPYNVPNVYVDYVLHNPGVPSGFWRSVGNSQNAFIMESFVDELAAAAGKDPFEYRLQSSRTRATGACWSSPRTGRSGARPCLRACIAASPSTSLMAATARRSPRCPWRDGRVKVHRIVAAVDAGWVVDPDTFKAQIESGIVYGLSGALFGEITPENGRVAQSNFHDYPVPRISNVPRVEVHILQGEGEQGGAGEPGVPSSTPAVVNAIFAATGKRIRKLPVRPEDLRSA